MHHPMINPIKIEFGNNGIVSEVGRVLDQDIKYKFLDNLIVACNVTNPSQYVYTKGGKGSRGFAGRTIEFSMIDGTTFKAEGPFKTTHPSFSALDFSRRIIALKRHSVYPVGIYEDILLYDEQPQRGLKDAEVLAKAFSDYLGVTVFYGQEWETTRIASAIIKEGQNG